MPDVREEMMTAVIDPTAHADPKRLHNAYAWLRKNDPIARAEL